MSALGFLYVAYLAGLLVLPLLVRWRWGLVASLLVTAAEVALVVLLSGWLAEPNPYPFGGPNTPSNESPLLQIRRSQGHAYAMSFLWVVTPAAAALIGGGAALVCSAIAGVVGSLATSRMGDT